MRQRPGCGNQQLPPHAQGSTRLAVVHGAGDDGSPAYAGMASRRLAREGWPLSARPGGRRERQAAAAARAVVVGWQAPSRGQSLAADAAHALVVGWQGAMAMRPTWEPLWCACKACGHWWDGWQPCHVPVKTWIAHIKTLRCPSCGKGGRALLLRTQPLDQKPSVGFTD